MSARAQLEETRASIRKSRDVLFIPCYIDLTYLEVGIDTFKLLERFPIGVGSPLSQLASVNQTRMKPTLQLRTTVSLKTSLSTNLSLGLLEVA
jgi:hypothetical protein